jgi:hypothetical protein
MDLPVNERLNVWTASVTGVKYSAVFVDIYSGSKHVEFLTSKNHFIVCYKHFILTSDDTQKRFALIKVLKSSTKN